MSVGLLDPWVTSQQFFFLFFLDQKREGGGGYQLTVIRRAGRDSTIGPYCMDGIGLHVTSRTHCLQIRLQVRNG